MNRALYYGEGLFETLRWKGENEKLRLHYRRLKNSADFFGIPCPSYEEFLSDITTAVGGGMNKYVKYCLFSEGGEHFADEPTDYISQVIVKELPVPPKEVKLCLSPYRRHSANPLHGHKTTGYLFNVLVKRNAKGRGYFDGVVLNEEEAITECSSSNLLLLKGGRLYTPAKECGLLWGTTLEVLARELDVREERLKLQDLEQAQSIFLLNSLIGAVPVSKFESASKGIDRELHAELLRCIDRYEKLSPQG